MTSPDPPGHRWGSPPCGQSWGCWWPPCRRTPSTTTVQTGTGGGCSLYTAEGQRGTEAQQPVHASLPRRKVLHLNVELSEVVVQNPAGQTSEAQVGAEARRTGVQRTGVDPGVLQVGHPHLQQHQDTGETQPAVSNGRGCRATEPPGLDTDTPTSQRSQQLRGVRTFLSRCLWSLSKASDSPPRQTAGANPAVLNPGHTWTKRSSGPVLTLPTERVSTVAPNPQQGFSPGVGNHFA